MKKLDELKAYMKILTSEVEKLGRKIKRVKKRDYMRLNRRSC